MRQSVEILNMGEVNLIKFLSDNVLLVGAALVSGTLLVWPFLRRGLGGTSISPLQATLLMNQHNALVLDVRSAAEYEKGHMLNARNIPLADLEARATELEKHKTKAVLVVCDTGNHSTRAAATLRKLGFGQVVVLGGGIGTWQQAGLPLEK
jgi:rhodanese-related sulfurtransferase